MSVFVCASCDVLENATTSRYWTWRYDGDGRKGGPLCSMCDPKIRKWHGLFPREEYDPEKHVLYGDYVTTRRDSQ